LLFHSNASYKRHSASLRILDCLNAGDDVKQKKPDPSIYVTAAKVVSAREADIV
jgi:beta-phosphoglucomutase-like phosphatase (HAD superfamily)